MVPEILTLTTEFLIQPSTASSRASLSAIDSIEEEFAPVFSEIEQLGEWLQQFFTSKIDSLKQYFCNLGGLIAYMETDFFKTPLSNAAPIYVDIDTFRRYLERYIYRCLPPDNFTKLYFQNTIYDLPTFWLYCT